MTQEMIGVAVAVGLAVAGAFGGAFRYLATRDRERVDQDMKRIGDDIGEIKRSLPTLEQAIEGRLSKRIEELDRKLDDFDEELSGVKSVVTRVDERQASGTKEADETKQTLRRFEEKMEAKFDALTKQLSAAVTKLAACPGPGAHDQNRRKTDPQP